GQELIAVGLEAHILEGKNKSALALCNRNAVNRAEWWLSTGISAIGTGDSTIFKLEIVAGHQGPIRAHRGCRGRPAQGSYDPTGIERCHKLAEDQVEPLVAQRPAIGVGKGFI